LLVDTIHLAAAALWLGGLLQAAWLAATRRSDSDDADAGSLAALVHRLSSAARVSVGGLVMTGAGNTSAQVGRFDTLARTAYGQSLLLKLAVLVPLLAVAAINRLVLRPRLTASSGRPRIRSLFTRLVQGELALAAVLLIAVGLLGSLPPPGNRGLPAEVES